jgi:thiol:disulfide interchange protein
MMTSIMIIVGSLLTIALANYIPLLPRSWLDKVRVFLGLIVTILTIWNLWPFMNRTMRATGAIVLGISGIVIVDKAPIISSLVPKSTKIGVQVVVGAVAVYVALINTDLGSSSD